MYQWWKDKLLDISVDKFEHYQWENSYGFLFCWEHILQGRKPLHDWLFRVVKCKIHYENQMKLNLELFIDFINTNGNPEGIR